MPSTRYLRPPAVAPAPRTPAAVARAGAVLLAGVASAPAEEFLPVASITSSTGGADLYPAANLIQGPGVGYGAEEPHDQLGGGSTHRWVTDAPGGFPADYIAVAGMPVLTLDLGGDVALSEVSVWGYAASNANGTKTFRLRFATAAEGTGGFGSSLAYAPTFTADNDDLARQSFPFAQTVIARYVEFTCTDNFFVAPGDGSGGETRGGDRVGLGEIAFADTVPSADPWISLPAALDLDLGGDGVDVTVTNLGATRDLVVSEARLSGADGATFAVVALPAPIPPGASGVIELTFNPGGLSGAVRAVVEVVSNDPETPAVSVALEGFLHDPKAALELALDFGVTAPGGGALTSAIGISNRGGGRSLAITGVRVTGTHADHFSAGAAPANLAPLADGRIEITFDPGGEEGSFFARLEVTTDDPVSPVVTASLVARVGDGTGTEAVRINEFMAGNGSVLEDGDGDSPDWIELYNPGDGAVDLTGWHLTDDPGDLTRWTFPPTVLGGRGHLVVFASGRDTVDAGGFLHTDFRLSLGGEFLALVRPDGRTVESAFQPAYPVQFNDIAYGIYPTGGSSADLLAESRAQVLVPGDGALGRTWTMVSFTPGAGWAEGPGRSVGYEASGSGTYDDIFTIDLENEMSGRHASAYIRLPFTAEDAAAPESLTLRIRWDDGFVAYLNGVEIATRNAPAAPAWDSSATGSHDDAEALVFEPIDVSEFIGELRNGPNVLAIHGLNNGTGSSDFLIDAELVASRPGSGPPALGYLLVPTPGAANDTGAANPGPEITAVAHAPVRPAAGEDIVVTVAASPRLAAVGELTLNYRVMFGAETSAVLLDNGAGVDAAAGDGVFSAAIPASAYGAGQMVRWYVAAEDVEGNRSRAPAFLDREGKNQSPEYFGTVVADPAEGGGADDLPVFSWFARSASAGHSRSGTRASVFFADRFYDNIFVRQRGGATNASESQKFDFNKGDPLDAGGDMPAVGEININGRGSDSTYLRQPLAFDTYRSAGNAACLSGFYHLRVNGAFDRVGIWIEQVDEDFLDRNGYDPRGDLYKFIQRGNLNPVFADTSTGIQKETGDRADLSSAAALVAGLALPTADARRRFLLDHLDLPQVVNYLAVRSITQEADDVRKNFYMYVDTPGDGLWRIFPWDKDWTFGVNGDGGPHLPHPFFGDQEHPKLNANQWNVLYDVIFGEEVTRRIYLRRLRTLMDTLLQAPSTPAAERLLEARAREVFAPADPLLSGGISSVLNFFPGRRSALFNDFGALIPGGQPARPQIAIAGAEFNPASGDQDEEFVHLTNPEDTEVDLSGWTLSGAVRFTFAPGTVIPRRGSLFVSPDTRAFRGRALPPRGGEGHLAVGPYAGHLSNFGETLTLANPLGETVATFTTPAAPSPAQLYLVVSEIFYHPADPHGDAEFIELLNTSPGEALDLGGVSFTRGVAFTFPDGFTLAPGERVVVVFDPVAFEALHGPDRPVAGAFEEGTRLGNDGETIKLEDASGSTVAEFSFNDRSPWPLAADGAGASLVLRRPGSKPDPGTAANWRPSAFPGGSPGESDATVFTGDPGADADRDGVSDLVHYALAGATPLRRPALRAGAGGADGGLTLTFRRNLGADDVTLAIETSTDLDAWQPSDAALLEETVNGDGTGTQVWDLGPAPAQGGAVFFRLRVARTLTPAPAPSP